MMCGNKGIADQGKVLAYIEAHEGTTIVQMAEDLGYTWGSTYQAVLVLIEKKDVKSDSPRLWSKHSKKMRNRRKFI